MPKSKRLRLDDVLVRLHAVRDRAEAFILVTKGSVFVGGEKAVSPAQMIYGTTPVELRSAQSHYVSRAGEKLEAALARFPVSPEGKICADIGAATGGFTQALLRHGAKRVYALDTARGKLALKIRDDPRVIVLERTDARAIHRLPEVPNFITIDVSLISLRDIVDNVGKLLAPSGAIIALFKPQYETRNQKILRHGVVTNAEDRQALLHGFLRWAEQKNWRVEQWMESPIRGAQGNIEYLLLLRRAE